MADIFDELLGRAQAPQGPIKPPQDPISPVPPKILEGIPESEQAQQIQLWRQRNEAKRRSDEQFMASFRLAAAADPEFEARAINASKRLGLPLEYARQSEDVAKTLLHEDAADIASLRETAPFLYEQLLGRHDFMRVAFDDVETLRQTEGLFDWIGRNFSSGLKQNERGYLGYRDRMGWASQDELDQLYEIEATISPDEGFIPGGLQLAGQMTGTLPPAVGAGLAVGVPTAVFGTPAGGLGAGLTAGGITWAGLGGVIEGGNLFLNLVSQGVDRETAGRMADAYMITAGVTELVGAKVAGAPLRKMFARGAAGTMARSLTAKTAGNLWGQAVKQYVLQQAGEVGEEMLQEAQQVVFENIAFGETGAQPTTGFLDAASRVASVGAKAAQSMALLGIPMPAAQFVVESKRLADADRHQKFLSNVQENVNESKVTERTPSMMEDFLASQAHGGPAENVHIEGRKFAEVLDKIRQSEAKSGVSKESVLAQLEKLIPGLPKQIADAAAKGGDVVVPLEQWKVRVGRTDLGPLMLPHLRLSQEGISLEEAQETAPQLPAMKAQAQALLREQKEKASEIVTSAAKVKQEVVQMLTAAKRLTPAQARGAAEMFEALVVTSSIKEGITPEQWWEKHKLTIMPGVAGAQSGATLSQADIETPEFKAWFGESKITDAEGRPLRVFHGSTTEGVTELTPESAVEVEGAVFFTDQDDVAEQYRFPSEFGEIMFDEAPGDLVEAHLRIENPMEVDLAGAPGEAIRLGELVRAAKAAGHDGLIIRNVDDTVDSSRQLGTTYVVFDPTQIKSVNNRGTFSGTDPNIFQQLEFYSALERQVQTVKEPKSAQGWTDLFRKWVQEGKVSKIELEMVGAEEFIKSQTSGNTEAIMAMLDGKEPPPKPKGVKVSPEDVAAHVRRKNVVVESKTPKLLDPSLAEGQERLMLERQGRPRPKVASGVQQPLFPMLGMAATNQELITKWSQMLGGVSEALERIGREYIATYLIDDESNREPDRVGIDDGHLEDSFDFTVERPDHEDGDLDLPISVSLNDVDGLSYDDDAVATAIVADDSRDGPGTEREIRVRFQIEDATARRARVRSDDARKAATDILAAHGFGERADLVDSLARQISDTITFQVNGTALNTIEQGDLRDEVRDNIYSHDEAIENARRELTAPVSIEDLERALNELDDATAAREDLGLDPDDIDTQRDQLQDLLRDWSIAEQSWAAELTLEPSFGVASRHETSSSTRLSIPVRFAGMTMAGGVNHIEITLHDRAQEQKFVAPSAHAMGGREKNRILHVRANDRQLPDGSYELFIEEIQSDWAKAVQAGKLNEPMAWSEAEDWMSLGFKQIVMHAIERGYDRVTFINGAQVANRWSLRNVADKVVWTPWSAAATGESVIGQRYVEVSNKGRVIAKLMLDKDGKVVSGDFVGNKLEDVVGHGISKKILAGEQGSLDGDEIIDLSTEGRTMTRLYNSVLPKVGNRALRQIGGGPLETVKRDLTDQRSTKGYQNSDQLSLVINDGMRKAMAERGGFPHLQKPGRGEFEPATLLMRLFEDADFSTFAHEMGHYYLTVLMQMASSGRMVSQTVREDAQTLLDWWGIGTLEEWNAMTLEEQRKHHEAWAYNFEKYLFEGKAPSLQMASLFERAVVWLKQAYKTFADAVSGLNRVYKEEFGEDLPILTNEVRQVMDRMLASDEQIQMAKAVRGWAPLFQTQEQFMAAGHTVEEWNYYRALAMDSDDEAVRQLRAESLKQLEWFSGARARELKRLQDRHKAARKKIQDEVTQQVMAEPVYRILDWLRSGKFRAEDGTFSDVYKDARRKLDRRAVEAMFPDIDVGTQLRGLTEQGTGLLPDVVAEMFGFPGDGRTMMQALLMARPLKEAVAARTDARMWEEYGGPQDNEEMEVAVSQALHNEARARFVTAEFRFADKSNTPIRVLRFAARMAARQALGETAVKDVRPDRADAAESRAERRARKAMASNEEAAAQLALRDRMLQNALANESHAVREEIEKAIASFARFRRSLPGLAKRRNTDLVNVGRVILAAAGLDKTEFKPEQFTEQLKTYDPQLYEQMLPMLEAAKAGPRDYRTMTVNEFRLLRDTLDTLWHQSRRNFEVMVEGKKMSLAVVANEFAQRMDEIGVPEVVPGELGAPDQRAKFMRGLQHIRAWSRRVEHWADAMDGKRKGADAGPFTKYLFRPIRHALDRYRTDRNLFVKRFVKLLEKVDMPHGKIAAPELGRGYVFGNGKGGNGMAELLAAMLHMGNQSNLNKLLGAKERPWTPLTPHGKPMFDKDGNAVETKWQDFISRLIKDGVLKKEHFDFLQAVWDLNEEIKPLAQRAHFDLKGYRFKEVEARPIQTPFGTYRGGYVPAKTDQFLVSKARTQAEEFAETDQNFLDVIPRTEQGFTQERSEGYMHALNLDLRRVAAHIDEVVRYVHVQPAIRDALRILGTPAVRDRLNRIDPTAIDEMLIPFLHRASRQAATMRRPFTALDRFWNTIRKRTGMAWLFSNLANALQQLTGLSVSMTKVKPRYLIAAEGEYWGGPRDAAKAVSDKSEFMANRLENQMFDMADAMNEVLVNPSKFEKIQDWSRHHAYFLQHAFQNHVDIVTWLGAYNQGVAGGMTEQQAIAEADSTVRQTQGSVEPEDVARFEAGSPFMRILTQFSGYFNALGNLNLTEMRKVVDELGWKGGAPQLLGIYMLGFAVPMLLSDGIVRTFGDEWDDDDDNGSFDEVWLDWLLLGQARGAISLLPFGNTIGAATLNAFDNKPYNDRMLSSPAISAMESATVGVARLIRKLAGAGKDRKDNEITGRNIKDLLTLLTLMTGIPFSAAGKPLGFLRDVDRREIDQPANALDFARGLVGGR